MNPETPQENTLHAHPKTVLYSPGQIAWATSLGAPIAGCVILGLNYRRLGALTAAKTALIAGVIGTALIVLIAFALPHWVPNQALPMAYTFAVYQFAKRRQGKAYKDWLEDGARKGSGWVATGVGIVCLVLLLAVVVAVTLVMQGA